jgi:hypothetical protein
MTECLEQRYCIKFCQTVGDTQAETIRKIQQAFGDDAMGGSLKLYTTQLYTLHRSVIVAFHYCNRHSKGINKKLTSVTK